MTPGTRIAIWSRLSKHFRILTDGGRRTAAGWTYFDDGGTAHSVKAADDPVLRIGTEAPPGSRWDRAAPPARASWKKVEPLSEVEAGAAPPARAPQNLEQNRQAQKVVPLFSGTAGRRRRAYRAPDLAKAGAHGLRGDTERPAEPEKRKSNLLTDSPWWIL